MQTQLLADRRGCQRVIAGNHFDADAGILAFGNRSNRLDAWRIDNPDHANQFKMVG